MAALASSAGLRLSVVEQRRSAGAQVHGHRGERDRQLLDPRRQSSPGDQPTQAAIGEEAGP